MYTVTVTVEEAFGLMRVVSDILQLKDDTDFMTKLLYNSNAHDLKRVVELRDKIASQVNTAIQAKLNAM